MKTHKYIFISLFLFFSLSCEDLVEEKIYGSVNDDTFWNTEADLNAGIAAAYSQLGARFRAFSIWQYAIEDLSTDYGYGGYRDTYPFSNYTGWSSTEPQAIEWGIWSFFWKSLSFSNKVIEEAPGADVSQEIIDQYTGEAKALRSLVYFYLINWFGEVPLVTSTTDSRFSIPRATLQENYAFLEQDLEEAVMLLMTKSELSATTDEYGRATKGAAQALLTKVYLQQGKWTEAASVAGSIIESGEYSLYADYADIFNMSNEGFQNQEVIWPLAFIGAGGGLEINGHFLFPYLYRPEDFDPFPEYNQWDGDMAVTNDFYDSFEAEDERRTLLLREYEVDGNVMISDPPVMMKYPADPTTEGSISGNDFIIFRFADVLLMRAESLNELGSIAEALGLVNQVRNRAGLNDLLAQDFDVNSLRSHIFQERKWELYFEGKGRQDMQRQGTLLDHIITVSVDAGANPERYLKLPIPLKALSQNPGLIQNPGF